MGSAILVLAAWLGLMLPGVLVARSQFPGAAPIQRLAIAATCGVAIAVLKATALHTMAWTAHAGRVRLLEVGFLAATLLMWAWTERRNARLERPLRIHRNEWIVVAVAVVGACLRMWPHHFSADPTFAFDAAAHCTLVESLAQHPGLATWLPFMDATPHYPWGSHALVLELHLLTGVAIHGVFSIMLTAGLGLSSILVLAGLAERIWRCATPAIGAAWVYAFLSGALGVFYSRWGGLPAELGFCLMLGVGLALLSGRRGAILAGLCWAALLLSHHLGAMIGVVMGGSAMIAVSLMAPRYRRAALRGLAWIAGSSVVAAPMWWHVLKIDAQLGHHGADGSAALSIPRHMDLVDLLGTAVGPVVLVLAVVPLAARTLPPRLGRLILLASTTGAVLVFALTSTGAQLAAWALGGEGVALVPTRWATATTFPLCILAGGGAATLWRRAQGSSLRRLRWPILLALTLTPIYPLWRQTSEARFDPDVWAAHSHIGEVSSPTDVVVSITHEHRWAGYLGHIQASTVPAPPGSDPLTPQARARAALPGRVLRGLPAPASDPSESRTYYVVIDARVRPSPQSASPQNSWLDPIWRSGPVTVFCWRAQAP